MFTRYQRQWVFLQSQDIKPIEVKYTYFIVFAVLFRDYFIHEIHEKNIETRRLINKLLN